MTARRLLFPCSVAAIVLILAPASLRAATANLAAAAKADPASLEFFERKIRPILVQNCYQCHSSTSDKLKGGLHCDSRDGLLKGGDSGPALVPGNASQSALIKAVQWQDKDLQMPPKTKLSAAAIADLTKWIDLGAPWPAQKTLVSRGPIKPLGGLDERYAELRQSQWSWQPVKAVSPPVLKDASWAQTGIDAFVLAGLQANRLQPVADADRVTLIRRVTFDLIGLPPTPDEVVSFVNDQAPDAYEKLVDRLLASPRFGETWGRHWLDVARYAESTGSTRNYPYQAAWRYRDYVIDSFNADKPYNTFITEQIAGDLMPAKDAAQKNERLIATGFLAMGVKDLNEKSRDKFVMDNVDEQIDTMSRSILATTIACARCHDHKFDPIPTEDYYKIAGIFKSTEILAGVTNRRGGVIKGYGDENELIHLRGASGVATASVVAEKSTPPQRPSPANAEQIQAIAAKLEAATAELQTMRADLGLTAGDPENTKKILKKQPAKAQAFLAKRREAVQLRDELTALRGEAPGPLAAVKETTPPKTDEDLAIGVRDESHPVDCRINVHGDHENLGAAVPRGFISLVKVPAVPTIKATESGRVELAEWLTSPQNPLTARVMINRIWHHLFGQGIVRTVDNFGSTGEAPSNPQLLDFLAAQFVRDGWSVKKMIRTVVLSRTYRLGSAYNEADYGIDPDNTFIWRHSQKRLDAEQIRDALLAIGGNLDLNRPLASPVARLPDAEIREGRRGANFNRDGGTNRSVYVPVVRSLVSPMMDVFDFAEPTMVTGDRDVTTVATQALFLMNDAFTIEQSRRLADRLMKDSAIHDESSRVDHAYGWTLGRSSTPAEKARAVAYIAAFIQDAGGASKKNESDAWTAFCQALVASGEFRYLN